MELANQFALQSCMLVGERAQRVRGISERAILLGREERPIDIEHLIGSTLSSYV